MATSEDRATAPHLLVVIDHQEARVYRTEVSGAVPERITPYDPHGYGRHLHSAQEWTDGKRLPERKSFYEAVAKTLSGAGQVLLFGSGTGRSSAMDVLLADQKTHHPQRGREGRRLGRRGRPPHDRGRVAGEGSGVLRRVQPEVIP